MVLKRVLAGGFAERFLEYRRAIRQGNAGQYNNNNNNNRYRQREPAINGYMIVVGFSDCNYFLSDAKLFSLPECSSRKSSGCVGVVVMGVWQRVIAIVARVQVNGVFWGYESVVVVCG
jgi:hypothetical protein